MAQVNNEGNSPTHLAAQYGNESILEFLIEQGIIVSQVHANNDGNTPAHLAAAGGHENILEWLVGEGVELSQVGLNHARNSLVHLAAEGGHVFTLNYLIHQGADVSVVNGKGKTALDLAKEARNSRLIEILTAHEAETHLQDELLSQPDIKEHESTTPPEPDSLSAQPSPLNSASEPEEITTESPPEQAAILKASNIGHP